MLPDLRPANSRIYSTSHFGMISNQGVDTQLIGDVCPFNVLPHQGRKWQIALQIFHEMDSWQVSSMTGMGQRQCKKDLRIELGLAIHRFMMCLFLFLPPVFMHLLNLLVLFVYACTVHMSYVTIFWYMHVMIRCDICIPICIISIFIISNTVSMFFFTYIGPLMIDFRDHRSGGTRHSSLQHHCQRSAKSWARQPKGSKRNGRNPERLLFGSIKKTPKLGGFGSWWNDKVNWYRHSTKAVTKKKEIYFPENMHVLEKRVVGRLLCFRNDPFLGDMFVFVGVVLNFRDLINVKHFFEVSASAGWHSS